MTARRDPDARIAEFFRAAQPDLPDRTFEAVRDQVHATRQVRTLRAMADADVLRAAGWLFAAAGLLAVAVLALTPRQALGPGAPTPALPTPTEPGTRLGTPGSSPGGAGPTVTEVGPTRFTSPLYGYTLTLPTGWSPAQAFLRWDGRRQPGPDADVDKFAGPGKLSAFGFAGAFAGTLADFVGDRIAANARDHADTCPNRVPEINEPLRIGRQRWVLLGWDCGAVINQAVTVRAGIAYAFTFRDLGIDAATDPADRALFQLLLDSVELPS